MKLLAVDTAAEICAACVHDTARGVVVGERSIDIGKGHAEHLMDVIEGALDAAGIGYSGIDRLAVSVGPGSFTGVRVGVAAVRGLALALGVPAIGVTTLEAIAAETAGKAPGRPVLVAIDARRGEVYAQLFDAAGRPVGLPAAMQPADAGALIVDAETVVAGSGSELVLPHGGGAGSPADERGNTASIRYFAEVAATRPDPAPVPVPLYLRGANAKPQQGFALARRSG